MFITLTPGHHRPTAHSAPAAPVRLLRPLTSRRKVKRSPDRLIHLDLNGAEKFMLCISFDFMAQ